MADQPPGEDAQVNADPAAAAFNQGTRRRLRESTVRARQEREERERRLADQREARRRRDELWQEERRREREAEEERARREHDNRLRLMELFVQPRPPRPEPNNYEQRMRIAFGLPPEIEARRRLREMREAEEERARREMDPLVRWALQPQVGVTGGGGAVNEKMIEEARAMREKDESNLSTSYSRACVVCTAENPTQRAVFTRCGHIVCYPCAVDNARSDATGGRCVFCRQDSGFVKLFEEENGTEKQ